MKSGNSLSEGACIRCNEASKTRVALVVILILAIAAFMGCKKDQTLVNESNPYDKYGVLEEKVFIDIKKIMTTHDFKNKQEFDSLVNIVINKHKDNTYPKIDSSRYEEYENSFIADLFKNANNKNLIELSRASEGKIVADSKLNAMQKERLLAIVSQFKFAYHYDNVVINYGPYSSTFEEEFDRCMNRELGEIFADDGNPVPEAQFIAGCPATFWWLAGSCAYEAAGLAD